MVARISAPYPRQRSSKNTCCQQPVCAHGRVEQLDRDSDHSTPRHRSHWRRSLDDFPPLRRRPLNLLHQLPIHKHLYSRLSPLCWRPLAHGVRRRWESSTRRRWLLPRRFRWRLVGIRRQQGPAILRDWSFRWECFCFRSRRLVLRLLQGCHLGLLKR